MCSRCAQHAAIIVQFLQGAKIITQLFFCLQQAAIIAGIQTYDYCILFHAIIAHETTALITSHSRYCCCCCMLPPLLSLSFLGPFHTRNFYLESLLRNTSHLTISQYRTFSVFAKFTFEMRGHVQVARRSSHARDLYKISK